ncbi:carboxymuconolactone decarboxylase family protein [Pseudomonas sp. LP_7_YM]|uniref:carboxymuconolactone decarboxylase family protein n=1 Tax=Pseudomonas sp. LP_7_YM TaxID=2485137 RepID=UPI00105F16FB|nr:carboxymuconolactone decarboxylase family protein [Pseudomonas sp. LP_7_YM]TDV71984.1 AhpD family alkylhydroperoxidase [Pseudomonas sp. LP_7_YM]
MHKRIASAQKSPDAYKARVALETAVMESGLDNALLELIRLRASQLNGCAYCVNKHANDARKTGETEARLQTLSVWDDTRFFSDREKAVLAWVESLTLLPGHRAPQHQYDALLEHCSEVEVVNITLAVATINAWNRFGVGFAMVP